MAEQWLKNLVVRIKEKDHKEAEAAAKLVHDRQIIKAKGAGLWRSFAETLQKHVEDMRTDFNDDVTLREGSLTFSYNPQTWQIQIHKMAFPYAHFSATFNQQECEPNQVTYASANPRVPLRQGVHEKPMPCRFEVSDGEAHFQIEGKAFHGVSEAARYVIEKLFKI